jgi:hypothetical protein
MLYISQKRCLNSGVLRQAQDVGQELVGLGLHKRLLIRLLMVVTQKMENPVDEEEGDLITHRTPLPLGVGEGDDDLTQDLRRTRRERKRRGLRTAFPIEGSPGGLVGEREGEHIGWFVETAIVAIEDADGTVVRYCDVECCALGEGEVFEDYLRPATQESP